MIRQANDHAFPHDFIERIFDRLASFLAQNFKDLRTALPNGVMQFPAGYLFGHWVHERNTTVVARDHDAVANAGESDVEKILLLLQLQTARAS